MKKTTTIVLILSILAILISAFILDDEIAAFDRSKEGIAAFFISIRFFFLNALLTGIVIYSIIRLIRKRTFGYLFPLVVCLIHFTIIISLRVKLNLRESSPIVLKADYFDEIHGLTISLRQNKTYKLSDYGFYNGANHFGDYRIIGNTILLSEKYPLGKDRDIMSNKLLIRNGFILVKPDSIGVYNDHSPFQIRIIKKM